MFGRFPLDRQDRAVLYTAAKNASIIEYRKATGMEALCGYLYLQGRQERIHPGHRRIVQRSGGRLRHRRRQSHRAVFGGGRCAGL